MIGRLASAAKRLQSMSPKTLAQQDVAAAIAPYAEALEKAAQ